MAATKCVYITSWPFCTVLIFHSGVAVLRGALMKGLASSSLPFASVSVSGRSARRNYGIDSTKAFDISKHDWSRRQAFIPC